MAARDSDLSADYLRPEKSDKIGEIDPLALRGPLQAAAPGAYAEAARGGLRTFAADVCVTYVVVNSPPGSRQDQY
jgi:hypothetical protein